MSSDRNAVLVAVECECCSSWDQTHNTPLVGNYHRQIDVWRCDKCGEPCSNMRCKGFQAASFEDGAR